MRKYKLMLAALPVIFSFALSTVSKADTFTFTGNDAAGDSVNAKAIVTLSGSILSVTLQNLLVNQKDVGQNISDVFIQLSSTPSSVAYSGTQTNPTVSVAGNGSFTTGTSTDTWNIASFSGGNIHLDDLTAGTCGPTCTILGAPGPGGYTNAHGSIAANPAHNPFFGGSSAVTFVLSVLGLNAGTTIQGLTFSFGTTAGDNHPGISAVPLPPAALLFGTALVGLGVLGRRRAKDR